MIKLMCKLFLSSAGFETQRLSGLPRPIQRAQEAESSAVWPPVLLILHRERSGVGLGHVPLLPQRPPRFRSGCFPHRVCGGGSSERNRRTQRRRPVAPKARLEEARGGEGGAGDRCSGVCLQVRGLALSDGGVQGYDHPVDDRARGPHKEAQ